MKKFITSLYLNARFFQALSALAILYVLAFFFPWLLLPVHIIFVLLVVLFAIDIMMLYQPKKAIRGTRILPEKLSNGDSNTIRVDLQNNTPFRYLLKIIDEVPIQFQLRDFEIKKTIEAHAALSLEYPLIPKERGEYHFASLNVFSSTQIGLISRRFRFDRNKSLPSYPSFIHLPKYELMAMQNEFLLGGVKKIRKIGHTMEFEQIKEYVSGDDIRSINWKATGKRNQLMVNQYQEEKAQRIYMLIDKGRTMKMPFEQLSLLDYSINATMALSHIILKKKDRAGMMTFSRKMENTVVANDKTGQLRKIAEALYNVQTDFSESDFGRLYADLKHKITQRSLILLFTNFETLDGLNRQLPYLRGIARNHLLVVVFFKNTEMQKVLHGKKEKMQDIYDQIIAEKFEFEKKLIRQELQKYGIQSIYTLPENLNISVINKYLEIKARGIL